MSRLSTSNLLCRSGQFCHELNGSLGLPEDGVRCSCGCAAGEADYVFREPGGYSLARVHVPLHALIVTFIADFAATQASSWQVRIADRGQRLDVCRC